MRNGIKGFFSYQGIQCQYVYYHLKICSNYPTAEECNLISFTFFISGLNLNSLLVKRQIDNPSPGAVTGGN